MKTCQPRRIRTAWRFLVAACCPTAFLLAQAAPNPSAAVPASPTNASAAAEEAIVLSPFQVDASAEKGYLATQTLNGTRLKTDLKDLGAALTIFTDQMLEDLGANSIYERKLFQNRIDWRLQLNVRNLLDENTVFPLVTVDTRDGQHTPSVAIYNLKEPRTYLFTSTFKF